MSENLTMGEYMWESILEGAKGRAEAGKESGRDAGILWAGHLIDELLHQVRASREPSPELERTAPEPTEEQPVTVEAQVLKHFLRGQVVESLEGVKLILVNDEVAEALGIASLNSTEGK